MDIYKLEKLLKKYEGPKLDFKARLKLETEGDKKELTKDIIAIANSKGGRGYIIFGVEDKTKRVLGIEPSEYDEEKIQQIICNRVNPPISIAVDILDYKGKKIAVLSIFKSHQQPHQMNNTGAFYIRRGSTTDVARREEIAGMFQSNGLYSYELTVLRKATMADVDFSVLRKYLHAVGVTGENPSEIILESLGFISMDEESGEYKPTIGGILLFGKDPSRFLPHTYIKVVFGDTIKYFYGNILSLIDKCEEYLKQIIEENYPFRALFLAIDNAIIHRDYTDITRGIVIEINDSNIVISNPGALLPENLIYKIEKDKDPRKRNPWLYQRLLTLDDDGRLSKEGLGIKKIKEAFKDVKFLNIGTQNLFKVILPKNVK